MLAERIGEIKGRAMTAARVGVAALALTQAAVRPEPVSAQQQVTVTSSEPPYIPEPKVNNPYQVTIDHGIWAANDEIRRLMDLGLYKTGDCVEILELLNPDSVVAGGDWEFRHVFSPCPAPQVAPVPVSAAAAPCVNIEVLLGTAAGWGATTNEFTATQFVIAHGDVKINGEFRADDDGATGLIQRVNASPANPARIEAGNPAWGAYIAAFCVPSDNEANIQQGVDNLRRQGMRADVLNWPGPSQRQRLKSKEGDNHLLP